MPIIGTKPYEVPAESYDQYWMKRFYVNAPGPDTKVSVDVELIPAKTTETGLELAKNASVIFTIPDIFGLAEQDAEIASIMDSLIAKITQLAKDNGVI